MSDILASIRKIMAQDPPSGVPAAVKPPANGMDGAPRAGTRLPSPEAPREPVLREPAQPTAPAPAPQPSSAAVAPTPSAKPALTPATGGGAAQAARIPAADEAVSLDEFLAMAARPNDVVTTPILAPPATESAKPTASSTPAPPASAPAPSDVGAPDWLFPRARPTDDAKSNDVREPVFGAAPIASPANIAHGPSLASPRPASPSTSAPKADAPPPNTPVVGPVATPAQAAVTRTAPPAPKMLGDLGSVVPGRFDSRTEGTTRRIVEPSADANDRYSPVNGPASGPTPAAPSRAETPRVAPDPAPPFAVEIPGADALRRLIAGVVPPSSLAPSAPARAPAPNADDIRTEVVLPKHARAPDPATVPNVVPRPAAPAAERAQPAPAAEPAQAAPAAKPSDQAASPKPAEPAIAAKSVEAAPAAKQAEPGPAAKPAEAPPAAKAPDPEPPAKSPEATPVKSPEPAPEAKVTPAQSAAAAGPEAPTPVPTQASSAAFTSGRTMDETVVELLRPLLRDWLNTNMPRLIEPALKAELEALRGVVSKDKKD